MRARGAPDLTAPSRRGVRTTKTLSPPRGGHDQHRTCTAPCPAAAPVDLPLAPAHVPAASAHRPAQHP
eukprot:5944169-Prymnesium_polylepis.1